MLNVAFVVFFPPLSLSMEGLSGSNFTVAPAGCRYTAHFTAIGGGGVNPSGRPSAARSPRGPRPLAPVERLDDVVGLRVERDAVGEAVGDDRPRQLLLAEVLRHLDREHAPLTAGLEMRRLPLIGTARLDAVVRSGGDVEY